MKIRTFLIVIIVLMQFSTLVNVTVFDGGWNGIILAFHTILFIMALGINAQFSKTGRG
ncbi:hypothetical protein [Lentibacillus sp. Marseille-P4043]|uniref:hypothetical protein n=1 Tax=Lentibacillus sp. Marseille-P4043 TaxID=2040293 RepID=UPI0018F87CDD|nr:hypothetical protein [Lentibacillus sp. Marseille-P4043]